MAGDNWGSDHDLRDYNRYDRSRRSKRKILIVGGVIALVILAAIGITLGIVLGSKSGSTSPNPKPADSGSTTTTTKPPFKMAEEHLTLAFNVGYRTSTKSSSNRVRREAEDPDDANAGWKVINDTLTKLKSSIDNGTLTVTLAYYADFKPVINETRLGSTDALLNQVSGIFSQKRALLTTTNPDQTQAVKYCQQHLNNGAPRLFFEADAPEKTFMLLAPSVKSYDSSTSFANDAKTAGPALAAIQKQLSKTLVVGVDNDQNMLKAYNLNTTDGVTAIPDGNVTQIVKNLMKYFRTGSGHYDYDHTNDDHNNANYYNKARDDYKSRIEFHPSSN
ncbi:hypothetical protein AAVH_13534 [Aphelenchoides avenae]|nr:hypothetical protein AAVH_13534 [Aphelenchus avenae]